VAGVLPTMAPKCLQEEAPSSLARVAQSVEIPEKAGENDTPDGTQLPGT